MRYSREYGVAAREYGWVPAPSYVLRRALVLDALKTYTPGRVLEIGCGSGALLYDLALRGFSGIGVEASAAALEMARKLLLRFPEFRIVQTTSDLGPAQFDYLLSFEVLEHIEDDRAALREWLRHVKSDGIVLVSVPAGRKAWDQSDVWAGHVRRYDAADLSALLRDVGLRTESFLSYGWPVANMIKPFRAKVNKRRLKREGYSAGDVLSTRPERTARSGIDRSVEARLFAIYGSWVGRQIFPIVRFLQRASATRQWGTGFLVIARKP